jgi:hypothetical protein
MANFSSAIKNDAYLPNSNGAGLAQRNLPKHRDKLCLNSTGIAARIVLTATVFYSPHRASHRLHLCSKITGLVQRNSRRLSKQAFTTNKI